MRSVVQRVDKADIHIEGVRVAGIRKGLLVFLGVAQGDQEADADYLSDKIVHLRIFEDENGKMNRSLLDMRGEILVVSQFTILADCRQGRRPSFIGAEYQDRARLLYNYFILKVKEKTSRVEEGEFQATMSVEIINNGPVTILLDSKKGV